MTPVAIFESILPLMLTALTLAGIAGRINIPPAALYVIGGALIAAIPGAPSMPIDPDLVMIVFLPPLLMASAYSFVWRDLRANMTAVIMMAVGAVIFTTLTVGLVAKAVIPDMPWAICFLIGAIVSPPDAVSAEAVISGLKIPDRLATIIAGESLFNDATSLIAIRVATAVALTGAFSFGHAVESFFALGIGGAIFGAACGAFTIFISRYLKNSTSLILFSFLISWCCYILAEQLGVSPVMAVAACGLVIGARKHSALNAETRIAGKAVWEMMTYTLEALIFIIIGLSLRQIIQSFNGTSHSFMDALPFALIVTLAMIVTRFIWVFLSAYAQTAWGKAFGRGQAMPPPAVLIVISWAGMRGVMSLATALGLPKGTPYRELIQLTTFVVIAVSLLVQGTTLGPLIKALRPRFGSFGKTEPLMPAYIARMRIVKAAVDAVKANGNDPEISYWFERLQRQYQATMESAAPDKEAIEAMMSKNRASLNTALEGVSAARGHLLDLHGKSKISNDTLFQLEAELDFEELHLQHLATRLK